MPTVLAYPVDAVDTDANATLDAPVFTAKSVRQAHSLYLAGATGTRPLGARTGVRPGTPTDTVTATATTWTVKPHAGVVDLEASTVSGPYLYVVAANLTGTVTPASGSGSRVDIIYAQINDSGESDGTPATTASHVKIDYAAGTTFNTGTPAATPARAFVLAYIDVPVSGGGSPTVRWVAPITAAAGGVIPTRDAAERTTLQSWGSATAPILTDCLDIPGCIMRSTGSTFTTIAGGPSANVTVTAANLSADGTVVPRVIRNGKMIAITGRINQDISLAFGAVGNFSTLGTFPAAYAPPQTIDLPVVSKGLLGVLRVGSGGSLSFSLTYTGTHPAGQILDLAGVWERQG